MHFIYCSMLFFSLGLMTNTAEKVPHYWDFPWWWWGWGSWSAIDNHPGLNNHSKDLDSASEKVWTLSLTQNRMNPCGAKIQWYAPHMNTSFSRNFFKNWMLELGGCWAEMLVCGPCNLYQKCALCPVSSHQIVCIKYVNIPLYCLDRVCQRFRRGWWWLCVGI